MKPVYILGGTQSDFARNIDREGNDLFGLFREVVADALTSARTEASDIGVCHVGNFVSDLFTGQAHLGGFLPRLTQGSEARLQLAMKLRARQGRLRYLRLWQISSPVIMRLPACWVLSKCAMYPV